VNGIRACLAKGFQDFIRKENPDVFCLQEVKAERDQCLPVWPEINEYDQEWSSATKPGYSGVATFLKEKLSHQKGIQKEGDPEGRLIVSELKDFYLLNSYIPNGAASDDRHRFKMSYLQRFFEFLKELEKKKPIVLCGDINIAHRSIDIHDPVRLDGTSGFKPEERAWMDKLFSEGFVDAFRHLHPEAKDQYSWWSYRAGARPRNKGWRIDYFIVSDQLKNRVKSLTMSKDTLGSDHCPVILELS